MSTNGLQQIFGGASQILWVALKAFSLYLTAVFGFRLGERRTLAEMSAFDFVAAVAVGAIVGRVPNASTTSYLEGATTLVTVLLTHSLVARLRKVRSLAKVFDHPPRILVVDGQILSRELRRAGLTQDDLYGLLRQRGFIDLSQIHYVIFEQRGQLSIVKRGVETTDATLLRDVESQVA